MDYVESVKPFCTYQQQIDKLEARGLIVRDKAYAESVLRSENYYRLRGYWLTMVKKQGTPPDDVFYPGTTFENIVDIYLFDVDLREIILSATSIIETNLKAYISYYHAQKYGPIGYMNYEHFEDVNKHIWMMYELQKDKTARKDELFVQHHKKCKGGIFPVWAATELMSFGQVSKFFKNMVREDRNKMSREFYNISSREYIESWIQCAVVARNIAAHGGRFYNRFLSQKFSFQIHLQEMGVCFGDMHMASICFCLQKRRTFSFPICHVQYRRTSTSSCGTSAFQMIGYKLCKEIRKVQEMANGVTVSCHLYSI